ncbi:hypothetical protein AMS60_05670 [Bacillus sp. FJAT-21945]|nr:hypothetical protein AMS60_05670 [Bacillus sp. FJAT-21945]
MYESKEILNKFVDYFKKNPNSNIGKLMTIFSEQLKELEITNNRIREWRDIDQAEGYGLDVIGVELNQPRGVATDEIYRVLLKSKNARNLSNGDINTIIQVLALALNTDYSNIRIREQWNDPTDPQEAAISLIELPIKQLNEVGLDPAQFALIVKRTAAGGVKVSTVELKGTFEFGNTLSTDPEKGFSNLEETTGGYFGAVFRSNQNQDLPL